MGKYRIKSLAFLVVILLSSCSFFDSLIINGDEDLTPTSITITNTETSLAPGETLQLNYTVEPDNADFSTLTWSTNDSTIVSVDQTGLVTAESVGSKTISVMIDGTNISDSILITVEEPISITITNTETSLILGDTLQLNYTIEPTSSDSSTISWSSSDTSILSVDSNGLVTAQGLGSSIITASIDGVNVNTTITLTVNEATPTSNTIYNFLRGEITVGGTNTLPDLSGDRTLDSDEITPAVEPSIGETDFVTAVSARKAISENHPDINTGGPGIGEDFNTLNFAIRNHVINNTNLPGTTYTHPLADLTDTAYNKVLFTESTIYTYIRSNITTDPSGYKTHSKMETIQKISAENKAITKIRMKYYHSIYSETLPIMISEYVTIMDIATGNLEGVQKGTNVDPFSGTSNVTYSRRETINSSNARVSMGWDDDRDQDFDIVTANGKVSIRTNVVNEGDPTESTSVHTDYWNLDNELIAIAPYQSNDEDISLSTSNTLGDYIQTSPLSYSLKRVLPLKSTYSGDYDLLSLVTQDRTTGTDIYKEYYLYRLAPMGSARGAIPAYNPGDDIYAYRNSFIDTVTSGYDIMINAWVENVYGHTGYFTWVNDTDISYFNGNSIATVATLKGEVKTLYDQYWLNFKTSTPDYSVLSYDTVEESEMATIRN